MTVGCGRCDGRLELIRTTVVDSRQYGMVKVECWRCTDADGCRGDGHRVFDGDNLVNVAGPVLDYAPEVPTDENV